MLHTAYCLNVNRYFERYLDEPVLKCENPQGFMEKQFMISIFPILILNARPAAGKSEIIRYLMSIPLEIRKERFRVGHIQVFDDFPILWNWFEEDDLLEKEFHLPRLHSTPDHYFLKEEYWDLLIRRLSLDYERFCRDAVEDHTAIIEFSRGSEHGGYQAAYAHLSDKILERAVSLYVKVSFEESLRKNQVRYNPERPFSIMEHSLDDEKMRSIYLEDDWVQFSYKDLNFLDVRDYKVPYAVLDNEDDITTRGGPELGNRLETILQDLWEVWTQEREPTQFERK
jgi:hypothetical protein